MTVLIDDAVQQVKPDQAHESSRHPVTCAVNSCYDGAARQVREPVEVAAYNILGHVKAKMCRNISADGFTRGKDRMLDLFRVINTVRNILVLLKNDLFLSFSFSDVGIDDDYFFEAAVLGKN